MALSTSAQRVVSELWKRTELGRQRDLRDVAETLAIDTDQMTAVYVELSSGGYLHWLTSPRPSDAYPQLVGLTRVGIAEGSRLAQAETRASGEPKDCA